MQIFDTINLVCVFHYYVLKLTFEKHSGGCVHVKSCSTWKIDNEKGCFQKGDKSPTVLNHLLGYSQHFPLCSYLLQTHLKFYFTVKRHWGFCRKFSFSCNGQFAAFLRKFWRFCIKIPLKLHCAVFCCPNTTQQLFKRSSNNTSCANFFDHVLIYCP